MDSRLEKILTLSRNSVPFHRRRAPENYLELENWPLMSRFDLADHPIFETSDLLSELGGRDGYIISSGATSGEPKYVCYSHREFSAGAQHVAAGLEMNGLAAGDRVLNYFSSGDMWGGFLITDRALSLLPVSVLPAAATPDIDFTVTLMERFRPNVVIGIPWMIVNLARRCRELGSAVKVDKVFFGGSTMAAQWADLLRVVWKTDAIRSAGYVTTDAGTIGWQCIHCAPDEHFPYDDVVLEIVDEELVVTSLERDAMPLIRYRTGDRGEWMSGPKCDCAGHRRGFRLKGRMDDIIIVWGAWLSLRVVEGALTAIGLSFTGLQVQVRLDDGHERVAILVEAEQGASPDCVDGLIDVIYQHSLDVQANLTQAEMRHLMSVKLLPPGTLPRSKISGKIKSISDLR